MAAVMSKFYNSLPTLEEAHHGFTDRAQVFEALGQLINEYDNEWGLCLVHAHCTVRPGEIMLATGNETEPVKLAELEVLHSPSSWTLNGEAFEHTSERTNTPPLEFQIRFRALVQDNPFLGFFYAGGQRAGEGDILLEHTEGRRNIVEPCSLDQLPEGTIETAWLPGSIQPIQMACVIRCETLNTRTGSYHKGKTHGSS